MTQKIFIQGGVSRIRHFRNERKLGRVNIRKELLGLLPGTGEINWPKADRRPTARPQQR